MGVVKGRRGSLNYEESCCLGGVSRNLHFLFSQTENSAMTTRLEKVSFHSNPQKGQWQRMFKVLYNCTYFTCQQGNAQNPSSQPSIVHEPRNSRCTSWIQKRQRNRGQIADIHWIIEKAREFQKNIYFCFTDYAKVVGYIDHNKSCKILKEMGILAHLICFWQNLYAGQETTVKMYNKAVCCQPAYLTSMQSTSC